MGHDLSCSNVFSSHSDPSLRNFSEQQSGSPSDSSTAFVWRRHLECRKWQSDRLCILGLKRSLAYTVAIQSMSNVVVPKQLLKKIVTLLAQNAGGVLCQLEYEPELEDTCEVVTHDGAAVLTGFTEKHCLCDWKHCVVMQLGGFA